MILTGTHLFKRTPPFEVQKQRHLPHLQDALPPNEDEGRYTAVVAELTICTDYPVAELVVRVRQSDSIV